MTAPDDRLQREDSDRFDFLPSRMTRETGREKRRIGANISEGPASTGHEVTRRPDAGVAEQGLRTIEVGDDDLVPESGR